jgi:hypothetical protein
LLQGWAFAAFLARAHVRGRIWGDFDGFKPSEKPEKIALGPFQSGPALVHTARDPEGFAKGCLLRKPPNGNRAPGALANPVSGIRFFDKARNDLSRGGAAR